MAKSNKCKSYGAGLEEVQKSRNVGVGSVFGSPLASPTPAPSDEETVG